MSNNDHGWRRRWAVGFLAGLLIAAAGPALAQSPQPEDFTGWKAHSLARAEKHMIAAANPDAVDAGLEMLRAGGSAADAAVAVQLVLNLVEPQSSGIGGGAFLLHHDGASKEVIAYDGRETAPAAATEELFLRVDKTPMRFVDAVVGGRSVGTPGTVALLAAVHESHGRLPWKDLFAPAIALAENGFTVNQRLAGSLQGRRGERLRTHGPTASYFFPGGQPLKAGDVVTNKPFAETLRAIAEQGPDAFYQGAIARDIVATVRGATGNPGVLAESDLAAYRVIKRAPLCHTYRGHRVCGMGPPSSGALTVGQILGVLEHFDLSAFDPKRPESRHLIAEASKLAFADRAPYMADADFVSVPVKGLLDPAYLTLRAQSISLGAALATPVAAGNPPWREGSLLAPDRDRGRPGTSHISIVDSDGNAVSMTTTIEGAFGSQLMVRGFLLNNELTDFSFVPSRNGRPIANRVEPGKRPRSSMAPTLVFDRDGDLELVIGSPGGSRIITYVAQTLVAVLDWGLDIQAAIDLGHIVNRNGTTDVEGNTPAILLEPGLAARGHQVNRRDLNSGLHGIAVTKDGLRGGADPRRAGVARGD
jgi:gamma-glutamyltranspeptidase/glutathione hydrolase